MFGFLAPARQHREYRQVYAAYCSHQRQHYGSLASIFTSYEASLCESGFDGCDCNDGFSSCLNGCGHECGIGVCDCCVGTEKNQDQKESLSEADPLIGSVAEAVSPLVPTGYLLVDGKEVPVQIESGSAKAGEKVVILRRGSFGYVVGRPD